MTRWLLALFICLSVGISARDYDKDLLIAEEGAVQKINFREEVRPPEQPKPSTQPPEPYRLKVGDRFLLSLYGEMDSKIDVVVSPTGTLSFLSARFIPAVGRTIPEVKSAIEEELKAFYRYPVVSITALDLVADHYTIIGEVAAPGVKPLIGNVTILSALSSAGGFSTRLYRDQTVDLVNLERSFLTRNGQYVPVDFTRLIKEGDLSLDLAIKPGDFLFMATYVMPKVYVVGEVLIPTTINYLYDISLAEALAEAGGVTRRASSRVAVIRGALQCPQLYLVDINRLLKGQACNFSLEPGDIVYVPPFRFTHFKDYLEAGIAAFVSSVTTIAGTNAFLEIYPKANGTDVFTPVPTIIPVVGGP